MEKNIKGMKKIVTTYGGLYLLAMLIAFIVSAIIVVVFFEQGLENYRDTLMGPTTGIFLAFLL